jgi:hypothetical protein
MWSSRAQAQFAEMSFYGEIIILRAFKKRKDSRQTAQLPFFMPLSLWGNLFNPHIMMTTSNTHEFNPFIPPTLSLSSLVTINNPKRRH